MAYSMVRLQPRIPPQRIQCRRCRHAKGRIAMGTFLRRVLAAFEKFVALVGIGGAVPGPGPHTGWPGGR